MTRQIDPRLMKQIDPRQFAKDEMRRSVPDSLWAQNQAFVTRLFDKVSQHRISNHPAIQALNDGLFDAEAIRQIHLDYRHAIVQIFTDALLMAKYQCRQLEPRFMPGQKMFPRFLLTFNVLDEFGFRPAADSDILENRHFGNPHNAHYPLYEAVLNDLNISDQQRQDYTPSLVSAQIREHLESAYDRLTSVVSLLGVGEEVVVLFSAPLRENVKALGVNVSSGYYWCHGTSDDAEANADDDTHAVDLRYVLNQALLPEEYEALEQQCEAYCDLWTQFWDLQMTRLPAAATRQSQRELVSQQ